MSDYKKTCLKRVISYCKENKETITPSDVHLLAVALNVDTIWIRDLADAVYDDPEREKTGFDKCNECMSCEYLKRGDCVATTKIRLSKKINEFMTCEFLYQHIKHMDAYFKNPEETKKRERMVRELSRMSVEDMFRPLTI